MTKYFTYLLRCEGGELYVGITTDLNRRFAEHAAGGAEGAKYTHTHKPVRMEASWEMPDRASASALEFRLKRLTHAQKEALCTTPAKARSLVADSVARARVPRVLMLGNSLATAHGLPNLVADAVGGEVVAHARGGARLSEHLNPDTRLGSKTQAALAEGGWTHVVLQERSDAPVRTRAAYLRAALALCDQIREIGALPIVYATWAYASECPKLQKLGMTHAEMHERLQAAFAETAAECDAELANVGAVFFEASKDSDSGGLYSADLVHPSENGAALAAAVISRTILGQ